MVTSPDYRHVPTGRLALLAQRVGKVIASPSTWYRLVRDRGWRRPRVRVHPAKPRLGIRATKPNETWHIDATVIRLLDGSHVYLHAVIDSCGVLRNVELACPIQQGPGSLGRERHITCATSPLRRTHELHGGSHSPPMRLPWVALGMEPRAEPIERPTQDRQRRVPDLGVLGKSDSIIATSFGARRTRRGRAARPQD